MPRFFSTAPLLATALLAATVYAGPEWIEGTIGHAGDKPNSAQPTAGSGTIARISGGLGVASFGDQSQNFQDMYIINISDPANFNATIVGPNGYADFDSQLWLFTIDGRGLLGNNDTLPNPANAMRCRADFDRSGEINCDDLLAVLNAWGACDCCTGDVDCDGQVNTNDLLQVINNWGVIDGGCGDRAATLGSIATDGTNQTIPGPGLYLLAVSSTGTVPASDNGPLFAFDCAPGEVSGPDGPGGADAITHWQVDDCNMPALGPYIIYLGEGGAVQMSGLFLDIKPDSCPNVHNVGSNGDLPVTIVGTDGFDPVYINSASIVVARADGVGGEVPLILGSAQFDDNATPFLGTLCDCPDGEGGNGCGDEDAPNADCITDLKVRFSSTLMREVLQLDQLPAGSTVELEVRGAFQDETPFASRDCIVIVPPADSESRRSTGSSSSRR